jgi:predicted nucleotidyltransferase
VVDDSRGEDRAGRALGGPGPGGLLGPFGGRQSKPSRLPAALCAQCSAVQVAEQAGLVTSRKVGNTRLVRANTASPYYAGLAEVLTRAFGVPAVLAEALRGVDGITTAYIYGSWAARHEGQAGQRPVGDIDVLVLGEPDRAQLYAALSTAEQRLARPVQAAIRDNSWLESGSGAFHNTVTSRPLTRLPLPGD